MGSPGTCLSCAAENIGIRNEFLTQMALFLARPMMVRFFSSWGIAGSTPASWQKRSRWPDRRPREEFAPRPVANEVPPALSLMMHHRAG